MRRYGSGAIRRHVCCWEIDFAVESEQTGAYRGDKCARPESRRPESLHRVFTSNLSRIPVMAVAGYWRRRSTTFEPSAGGNSRRLRLPRCPNGGLEREAQSQGGEGGSSRHPGPRTGLADGSARWRHIIQNRDTPLLPAMGRHAGPKSARAAITGTAVFTARPELTIAHPWQSSSSYRQFASDSRRQPVAPGRGTHAEEGV